MLDEHFPPEPVDRGPGAPGGPGVATVAASTPRPEAIGGTVGVVAGMSFFGMYVYIYICACAITEL